VTVAIEGIVIEVVLTKIEVVLLVRIGMIKTIGILKITKTEISGTTVTFEIEILEGILEEIVIIITETILTVDELKTDQKVHLQQTDENKIKMKTETKKTEITKTIETVRIETIKTTGKENH